MRSIQKNRFVSKLALALALGASLFAVGCATDDATEDPGQEAEKLTLVTSDDLASFVGDELGALVTHSFTDTCKNGWWTVDSQGVAREAGAANCKKIGGGYLYDRHWGPARCWGDLSNCNGNIVCQATCP